jgi:hypothetical protein
MAKIFYGLLFKDLSLMIDQSNPNKGTLLESEHLKQFQMVHEFLQSIRISITFPRNVFSIFTFKLHLDPRKDLKYDFHFTDDYGRSQLAIQIGEIGIICCIGEDGIIKETLEDFLEPYYHYQLNTLQFREIIGRVFYQRSRLKLPPSYIIITSEKQYSILSNLSSWTGNYFKPVNHKELAYFIYRQFRNIGLKFEHIYNSSHNAITTLLINDEGYLHIMDEYGQVLENPKIKHNKYKSELFPSNGPIIINNDK